MRYQSPASAVHLNFFSEKIPVTKCTNLNLISINEAPDCECPASRGDFQIVLVRYCPGVIVVNTCNGETRMQFWMFHTFLVTFRCWSKHSCKGAIVEQTGTGALVWLGVFLTSILNFLSSAPDLMCTRVVRHTTHVIPVFSHFLFHKQVVPTPFLASVCSGQITEDHRGYKSNEAEDGCDHPHAAICVRHTGAWKKFPSVTNIRKIAKSGRCKNPRQNADAQCMHACSLVQQAEDGWGDDDGEMAHAEFALHRRKVV